MTRRWIAKHIHYLAMLFALIASGVLLHEFWERWLTSVIGGLALFVMRENLRELRGK